MHELCELALFPQVQVNKSFTFQYKVQDLTFSYCQEARSKPRSRRSKKKAPSTQVTDDENGEDDQEEDVIDDQDYPEETIGT